MYSQCVNLSFSKQHLQCVWNGPTTTTIKLFTACTDTFTLAGATQHASDHAFRILATDILQKILLTAIHSLIFNKPPNGSPRPEFALTLCICSFSFWAALLWVAWNMFRAVVNSSANLSFCIFHCLCKVTEKYICICDTHLVVNWLLAYLTPFQPNTLYVKHPTRHEDHQLWMIKDLIGICSLFEGTITATDWWNWEIIQKNFNYDRCSLVEI